MTIPLTHREAELLEFIRTHLSAYGFAPSYDEMAVHLGLKSKSNIHAFIVRLERKGRIRRLGYRARGIEVMPDARHHPADCSCDRCASARYVSTMLLVDAMSNPAPAALAAIITAQWDAADENIPSVVRLG